MAESVTEHFVQADTGSKELKNETSEGNLMDLGLFCSGEKRAEDGLQQAVVCSSELRAEPECGIQVQLW